MSKHVNTAFLRDIIIVFTNILLTCSLFPNNVIEMFIESSENMGDLGINSGLPSLENSFGELEEDKFVVRRVYGTGVCHRPVPFVKKKLSQDRYIPPDRFWSWICIFLEVLHNNIRCYL